VVGFGGKKNQTMSTYMINIGIKTNEKSMIIQPHTSSIGAILGVGSFWLTFGFVSYL
jgi:hypothetical protein